MQNIIFKKPERYRQKTENKQTGGWIIIYGATSVIPQLFFFFVLLWRAKEIGSKGIVWDTTNSFIVVVFDTA